MEDIFIVERGSQSDSQTLLLKLSGCIGSFDFNTLTQWEIAKRRAIFTADFVFNFALYTIALLGFLLFAFYFYVQYVTVHPNLPFDLVLKSFWRLDSIYLKLFFITAFSDLYLVYRLIRRQERMGRVLAKDYSPSKPAFEAENSRLKRVDLTESYSIPARTVLEDAYLASYESGFREITPLHILARLVQHPKSLLILFRLGINPGVFAGKIKRGLEGFLLRDSLEESRAFAPVITDDAKKVILQAYFERYERGGAHPVDIVDLWMPIAEIPGYAKEILYDLDIEPYKLRHVVAWVELEENLRHKISRDKVMSHHRSKYGMDRAMTGVETRFLNAFSSDLTLMAKNGRLPPSLGHVREMEEIFTAFQGGFKGVVLVGAEGIGKQSMVEELAERMSAEQVPELLQDKRLVSLNLASLMAGGDTAHAAERVYRVFHEAAYSGNIVLFLKDIHTVVGVGLHGEGNVETMGLDQVVAQAIESGRFFIIGTTDHKNYSRYIERSSLHNTLTRINVAEPSFEETVLMLEARAPFIEGKHGVYFTYQSLEKAVQLTDRLIHTDHQPEKTYNLLREVAAAVASSRGRRSVVTEADIARILSLKTNMPLSKISEDEGEKLMRLEEFIHEKYIDQDYAVKQIAEALRRARAELRDTRRPIANFLFVGPTGVGKTELAKRIAAVYFNSEKDMIRIDMSEFQEIVSLERLIGTENERGVLVDAVRNNPFSILLLDELEKAHPNILNLFLQVMDDGRMTSYEGEVIDFTNLIIVATSNAGTRTLQEYFSEGRAIDDIKDVFLKKDLLEFFRPEFLNRFDDVIIFKSLSPEDIEKIAVLILKDIASRLEERGVDLKVTKEAVQELAGIGYDPLYGARPLRRAIQDHVQNALAKFLISGTIGRRDRVYLEQGGKIRIEKAREL